MWPEQLPLAAARDLGAVGELARLAEVVHDRGAQQQVAIQARVQRAELERHASRPRRCARAGRRGRRGGPERPGPLCWARPRRSSPLQAPAASRARGGSPRAAPRRRAGAPAAPSAPGHRPRARGARGSLRARRGRGRRRAGSGRVGLLALCARDRGKLDLQLIAKALDAPAHAHQLAALEAPGEHVGVAESARDDRPRAVAQLDRQVGSARARDAGAPCACTRTRRRPPRSQRSVATVWCAGCRQGRAECVAIAATEAIGS